MPKYDAESLMSDVRALLVAKLNTKIAAIEAEKIAAGFPATGITAVDTSAGYFEQSWSDAILNINPALFFGIEEISAEGVGPATGETFHIWVDILVLDNGQDALTKNRVHRYSRALREVFEENWDTALSSASKIKIETVRPLSFKLNLNSSETYKVGGVSIITAIA